MSTFKAPLRTLVFGRNGQVGWELERCFGVLGELCALDRNAVDLHDAGAIAGAIEKFGPDVIVNAAAYTNVDGAETDLDNAHAINVLAPQAMARAARARNALLVHYSTDYVFGGSGERAWHEDDATAPLNAYGRTKLAGEEAIRAEGGAHLILRTSWVYASRGKNFIRTILRLAQERDVLRVVDDQSGAPTWARFIAQATLQLVSRAVSDDALRARTREGETIHLANAGVTTWHGFATRACARYAESTGTKLARIDPIPAAEYKTAAVRPANSRLNLDRLQRTWGVHAPNWQQACDLVVAEIVEQGKK